MSIANMNETASQRTNKCHNSFVLKLNVFSKSIVPSIEFEMWVEYDVIINIVNNTESAIVTSYICSGYGLSSHIHRVVCYISWPWCDAPAQPMCIYKYSNNYQHAVANASANVYTRQYTVLVHTNGTYSYEQNYPPHERGSTFRYVLYIKLYIAGFGVLYEL